MIKYLVTGMSCAACCARVEKAVSAVHGVKSCSVNLFTGIMGVEGTACDDDIIRAVCTSGYGCSVYNSENQSGTTESDIRSEEKEHTETRFLRLRLIWSLCFLTLLIYLSTGHIMLSWPLPHFLAQNPVSIGLTELLLSIIIIIINSRFFTNGFRAVIKKSPNMDTLVALGASAAFIWSVVILFSMIDALRLGDEALLSSLSKQLYFESCAMILTFVTVGKTLESYSKGKTTDALRSLIKLAPATATVLRNGKTVKVPVEQVAVGDSFIVKAGEHIPVDGYVTEGGSAVDESALTGESLPIDKKIGNSVSSGTVNLSGYMVCRATRVGKDTILSQIIQTVSDATATKAPIAKIADKVSGIFVPVVMGIALLTAIAWIFIRQDIGFALARGISVLVISCPCALGLATPVAIMVGSGVGAKNGILFKTATALEQAGRIRTVVLDKTGTVTSGKPTVTDVIPLGSVTKPELLTMAYSLECKSEHPLAHAIVTEAKRYHIIPNPISDFSVHAGFGVSGHLDSDILYGGSITYMEQVVGVSLPDAVQEKSVILANMGKTILIFARNQTVLGLIAVSDVIKSDSAAAVKELKAMGLRVILLTGDSEKTAAAIGEQVGISSENIMAGVLPAEKASAIRKLQKDGKVCMVGDGINDAPALTVADLGIAIGAGTDIAMDAADTVLVRSQMSDVVGAIRLGRSVLRTIKQNLFWAFIYNVICIPLAVGVMIPFGILLQPMYGAAAMSLSSFCVVTNALRLNLFKHRTCQSESENIIPSFVSSEPLQRLLRIDGMMCGHCEAAVRRALLAVSGVTDAVVSYTDGTAIVTLHCDSVDNGILRQAVEAEDYTVLRIENI